LKRSSALSGYAAALGTVAIWAGFIIIARLGGKTDLTSWDLVALRLGTAALVLLPLAPRMPRDVWRDLQLWRLALIGGVLFTVLVYGAFKFAPAAHGAILLSGLQPFLIALVAWVLLGVRPLRSSWGGLGLIALGVACVAAPQLAHPAAFSPQQWLGDGLLLAASLSWAVYSVMAKNAGRDPWLLTRMMVLGSALIYLPIYLLFLPKQLDSVPMSMLLLQGLYHGIGPSIVAMLLFLKAVNSLGAQRTGAIIALVPVVAGLAATPLLDEALSAWLLAGLVLVSVGAWWAARAKPKPD